MPDRVSLAVIVVSANSAHWLRPCLATLAEHAGDIDLDVVVVASGCTDDTIALVQAEFSWARSISCENHGFSYANNRGLETVDADWVLFLNPDTQIVSGTLERLIRSVESRADVGLVGVRQLLPDGRLFPTIRRFPSGLRWLFEALGSERYPFRASWLGERELSMGVYERDVSCDWTTGAFMLVRRQALEDAGPMDERFFLYCEETDLCRRLNIAGWEVRHVPSLTIIHHAEKSDVNTELDVQAAFAKRVYADKHFEGTHHVVAVGALVLGLAIRAVLGSPQRRHSSRRALAVVLGLSRPPFASITQASPSES